MTYKLVGQCNCEHIESFGPHFALRVCDSMTDAELHRIQWESQGVCNIKVVPE